MNKTKYDEGNAGFSDRAHMVARRFLYPAFFNVPYENITFDEDTLLKHGGRGELLDGKMAIDRIAHIVTVPPLKAPLMITIQERFRTLNYEKYDDITITEWNHASNLPSELHKMAANFFVYGYVRQKEERMNSSIVNFSSAYLISYPMLLHAIIFEGLDYARKGNLKNQSFISIKHDELWKRGICVVRFKYGKWQHNDSQ